MTYGQTSAGKTYTLFGNVNTPEEGIVPRFSRKLFEKMSEIENGGLDHVKLTVSLFEIYKEKVFDLFGEETQNALHLREDPNKGVYFEGMTHQKFSNPTDFIDSLYTAFMKRKVSETFMNERSSRSHMVITFDVEISSQLDCQEAQDSDNKFFEITKRSKIIFIDLAGSERQNSNTAEVVQEGCSINRSLSILQHVISSIAKKNNQDFVHFRDSKLTHFLKEIFKGNSHFAILGNILAQPEHFKDTQNTLNFVALAKKIVTNPQINFETKEANKIFEKKVLEILSKKCMDAYSESSLTSEIEKVLSNVHVQSQRILLEIESIKEICSQKLIAENYDQFKLMMESINFEGFEGFKKVYAELNKFLLEKPVLNKNYLNRLKDLLLDCQSETDNNFESKKETLSTKLDKILSDVQKKLNSIEEIKNKCCTCRSNSMKKLVSKETNRSFDLTDKKNESMMQDNLMKTLKNHSKILKANEVDCGESQSNIPEPLNSSLFKCSHLLNYTNGSFLGSFMPPFPISNSKLNPFELEKDIAQSIQDYFHRERDILEKEKQKFEKEKNCFEQFRERPASFLKNEFKKSTIGLRGYQSRGSESPENDHSRSTLKVHTSNNLVGHKFVKNNELANKITSVQSTPELVDKNSAVLKDKIPDEQQIQLKKMTDMLNKKIGNLERQLRNRNKDYLFALKELEKIKNITSRRESSIENGKQLNGFKV